MDAGFVLKPPVDAITEFRILTHGSNAEFGHSTGSTTNIITRSGSNQIHGALWEFLRNDMFDATNAFAFDGRVEPLKQNQFGGTFGGPIKKDRTFFFASYEGRRVVHGISSDPVIVPTAAERGGDSPPCKPGFDPATDCAETLIREQRPRRSTSQSFHLHAISLQPVSDTSDFSRNLLSLFPEPNTGVNTFTSTVIQRDDDNQFGIRLDHYLTAKDSLNFATCLTTALGLTRSLLPEPACPDFRSGTFRAQNFVAQETHTFSPSMIGIFRFSFLRNKFLRGERFNHTTPGISTSDMIPLDVAVGPPFMQVSGYTIVGDPITGPRNTTRIPSTIPAR